MISRNYNKQITSFLLIGVILGAAVWALAQTLQASVGETAATCTVDAINGGTHASIQAAVDDPACDPIQVADGTYTENLVITRSVSIIGADYKAVIIDGNQNQVVWINDPNANVTISNITISGGNANQFENHCGGGVRNEGYLILDKMLIINNYSGYGATHTTGSGVCNNNVLTLTRSFVQANAKEPALYNGPTAVALILDSDISGNIQGGIYNEGEMTIRNSEIHNNYFNDVNGIGGGLLLEGPTTIENSVIRSNAAKYGAGIIIKDNVPVVINNTEIVSNTASEKGGGIDNYGILTVTNSLIDGNISGTNGYGEGGGIFVRTQSDARLVLINSTVTNNKSSAVGGGIGSADYLTHTATIEIKDSVISNNTYAGIGMASVSHTGNLLIENSVIVGNEGEGVHSDGVLTMTQTIVRNNSGSGIRCHNATISYSAIQNNMNLAPYITFTVAYKGGGIRCDGQLTIWYSAIADNTSSDSGGGIYFEGDKLEIGSSTVNSNTAGVDGGGIAVTNGDVTLTNTTISGNKADEDGGGMSLKGSVAASTNLNSATITENTADADGDDVGSGGGVYKVYKEPATGVVSVTATVIAGNVDNSGFILNAHDCYGDFTSLGFNFIGEDTACNGFTAGSDQVGTATGGQLDPLLLPLADNGGPTWTHSPGYGSPLIDSSDSPDCLLFDQRGASRPKDGDGSGGAFCDIGAFEVGVCQVPIKPFLDVTQNGNHLDLSWNKHLVNREVEVWRGPDGVPTANFSNIWTNPGPDTTYTDYDVIGNPTLDHFYYVQGQNPCGDYSAASNLVGELEFPVMAGGNGRALRLTLISVPLTGTIPATADDLAAFIDPNGSVKKVARWNKNTGSWIVRTVGAGFGTPNFPVRLGDVLIIGADTTAPASFPWVGEVPASGQIQYNLTKQAVNFISIPLAEATNFTMTAEGLAADIGGVRAVAMWDASQQKWVMRQVGVSGPNFTLVPGRPYAILTTNAAPLVWP